MSLVCKKLDLLWKKGREFLGTEAAIMGGAMSWISEANLVSAISNAGGFGIIACGSMSPQQLEDEIKKTRSMTDKPFGVNLIVMHPQIQEHIDTCINQKISHVVLAGGIASASYIKQLKSHGVKTLCFAPNIVLAKRSLKSGIDALIIEGSEAGGHIGSVSTSVLAQEILPIISEIPVFVAGGIGNGEMMLRYLQMGASGCQLGTKFVCAHESIAHPKFKEIFIKSSSRNTEISLQLDNNFPVIPVRAISNKATNDFVALQKEVIKKYYEEKITKQEGQLMIEKYWAGALRRAAIEGDIEYGSVMAGECVGMVTKEEPVKEIIQKICDEAKEALERSITQIKNIMELN